MQYAAPMSVARYPGFPKPEIPEIIFRKSLQNREFRIRILKKFRKIPVFVGRGTGIAPVAQPSRLRVRAASRRAYGKVSCHLFSPRVLIIA